ncbi:YceI family protein [Winogradskyella sp. 3972H.M.0a.05]|uniref:YceI family protein n=1 Tax=Winogradskyella sp. 3972H.M.0a.05 TaxID=2950277 RepID=UPI00339A01B1
MKKNILFIAFTMCTLIALNAQTTIIDTSEKLDIDITKSQLKWIGEYTFYFGGHEGIVDFKEGYFIKNGDVITGGKFVIDMHSIACTDNGEIDRDSGLVDHLKDEDFFEVNNFPEATMVITNVSYENNTRLKIFANLTIKGITHAINFRAEVDYEKEELIAKFKIDRQRWGIDYNSKLRDGAISDAIGFEATVRL